jgi:hypothetical protein
MIPFETFALAGSAIFTLTSARTGVSFTYRMRANANPRSSEAPTHFVDLLTGPDNGASYKWVGMVYARARLVLPSTSWISREAPSMRALFWTWDHRANPEAAGVTVRHAGRCCRCGRTLTTPESIDRGIGPECATKIP